MNLKIMRYYLFPRLNKYTVNIHIQSYYYIDKYAKQQINPI